MAKTLAISGGIFQHHKIQCPQQNIRPVMAKVRNSVFQIIFNYLHTISDTGATQPFSFLDIFSGSGLMAVESISRGFNHATAVEKDPKKWKIITQNFTIQSRAFTLIRSSAELFIVRNTHKFDVIYIDPPFAYKHKNDILTKVDNSRILHTHSLVIIHIPSQELFAPHTKILQKKEQRNFGGSTLVFFTPEK